MSKEILSVEKKGFTTSYMVLCFNCEILSLKFQWQW